MSEIWRPVADFPDYEVSNLGRVRSLKMRGGFGPRRRADSPRILKQYIDSYGRAKVGLRDNGRSSTKTVSVLVLEAFVGPRPGDSRFVVGSHLNGDPSDNRVENLIWETQKENLARVTNHGRLLGRPPGGTL